MNKVQQKILDQVVTPALNQMAGMVIGEVRSFNSRLHLGSVVYTSGSNEMPTVKQGVPLVTIKGVKKPAPLPGDPVLIGFMNNSYQQPVILAVLDKEHFYRTRKEETIHFRNGSNISDYYAEREGERW